MRSPASHLTPSVTRGGADDAGSTIDTEVMHAILLSGVVLHASSHSSHQFCTMVNFFPPNRGFDFYCRFLPAKSNKSIDTIRQSNQSTSYDNRLLPPKILVCCFIDGSFSSSQLQSPLSLSIAPMLFSILHQRRCRHRRRHRLPC